MSPKLNPLEAFEFDDNELALAEAEYEEQLVQAEAEVKNELNVSLVEDAATNPVLTDLDIQLQTVRKELLMDKAKLAYAERTLAEQQNASTFGRLKAKIRGKIAPVLIGLSAMAAVAPIPASIAVEQMHKSDSRTKSEENTRAFLETYYRDGADSKLSPRAKYQVDNFIHTAYNLADRTSVDEFKRVRVYETGVTGGPLFRYILDGKNEMFGSKFFEINPHYGFDIGRIGQPLTSEQMERLIDVYSNLRAASGKTLESYIGGHAKAEEVKTFREFLLQNMVKPTIEATTAGGNLTPGAAGQIESLKKVLEPEYHAWLDGLIGK